MKVKLFEIRFWLGRNTLNNSYSGGRGFLHLLSKARFGLEKQHQMQLLALYVSTYHQL